MKARLYAGAALRTGRRLLTDRSFLPILGLLLAADAALLVGHVVYLASFERLGLDQPLSWRWGLTHDGSYGEMFEYACAGLGFVACVALRRATRQPAYSAMAAGFAWLLLDNAAQLHEAGGAWLASHLGAGTILGLRAHDLGELVVFAGVGLALLAVCVPCMACSRRAHAVTCAAVALLIASVAVFGVAMDAAHALFGGQSQKLTMLLEVAEDGGELVALTLAAAAALAAMIHEYSARASRAAAVAGMA